MGFHGGSVASCTRCAFIHAALQSGIPLMRQLVTYFLIGLATSVALTPLCRTLALRAGYVAKPKDERWHRRPTALLGGIGIANHRALRMISYLIDTTLLGAAILLMIILHQYPLVDAWLTIKALLLVLYNALGIIALRRARTRLGRGLALLAALLTFGFMIGVAITHQPAGWLILLRR
jgi:uncharacterized membrane protein SirB2